MESMVNEALARKSRSEGRLAARGVPINPHLPVIEHVDEASIRPPHTVAERALALYGVLLHARGERAYDFLSEQGLWEFLSPKESAFVLAPLQHEGKIQYSWRSEALWVLLWALRHVHVLDYPDTPCDEDVLRGLLASVAVGEFIGKAKLLSANQLLDEADFIYRCHWAVSEADIQGQGPPGNLDTDVVYERHYALNWLVGYMNEEWDDISTDT